MGCCDADNYDPPPPPPGGSGAYALPEQWCQNNVAASQAGAPLSAQVSTNFDTIIAVSNGSLRGFVVRFTEPISAGEAVIAVTINGAASALAITCDSVSNSSGGIVLFPSDAIPYTQGDEIGVVITTDDDFAPNTTSVEAWVLVQDAS